MESLIDRRCAGCTRDCSDALYYECTLRDYLFYKANSAIVEKIEPAQNNPKYKAYGAYGVPSTIVEGINKFFAENPQAEIISITKLDGYEAYYPGVMVVVKEN